MEGDLDLNKFRNVLDDIRIEDVGSEESEDSGEDEEGLFLDFVVFFFFFDR